MIGRRDRSVSRGAVPIPPIGTVRHGSGSFRKIAGPGRARSDDNVILITLFDINDIILGQKFPDFCNFFDITCG
jgi:hypothetical protein